MKIFLFFLFFLHSCVLAKEPYLMELITIYDNGNYLFQHKKSTYLCSPYGVITLDKIYQQKSLNATCKKAIGEFIVSNAKLANYVYYRLKVREFYHIEFKNSQCLIFSKGQKSFSKELLLVGMAIIDPKLKDEIYSYKFRKAQQSALDAKRGLWKNYKVKTCVSELLKE